MTHGTHPHTPFGRDPRLSFSLGSGSWKLATLDEHASAAGMGVDDLLVALEESLENGDMSVEAYDGTLFLNTSPGAVVRHDGVGVNLWANLRSQLGVVDATQRWKNIRSLEGGGWRVEPRTEMLARRFERHHPRPWCSVEVQGKDVGVVWGPTGIQLSGPGGWCDLYSRSSEPLVAVVVAPGGLETAVAAVRQWVLGRGAVAGGNWLSVLVLEAPSFTATLLRCSDNSVTPVAFAKSERT